MNLLSTPQIAFSFALVVAALAWHGNVDATQPPAAGETFPQAYFDRLKVQPRAFTYKRALKDVAARAIVARSTIAQPALGIGDPTKFSIELSKLLGAVEDPASATRVSGVRSIPVLMAQYSDTATPPYNTGNLQRQLFDGPWPTGTMTEYYHEISNRALTVKGTVFPWRKLASPAAFYQGADYLSQSGETERCNGLCDTAKVPDLIRQLVAANKGIDWGVYDNDGPDGIPNSGDDDGFVDFIAIVHPERGGECGGGGRAIWSHRSSLTDWGGNEIKTTSKKIGGGTISIDDYVVMPALACDNQTMIQIGVFAHEFGHAFGLPDLYDTDPTDGKSAGVGAWCLMASGSWGGDGKSPDRPTHMSPWAKEFLGWLTIAPMIVDRIPMNILPVETSWTAHKVPLSPKMYYIVNSVRRRGFNEKLPGEGIQVWLVNDTVVQAGLRTNRVNADNSNRGVSLVEADGNAGLSLDTYRGGPGDIFPGASNKTVFDSKSNPKSLGRFSLCNIQAGATSDSADFHVASSTCAVAPAVNVAVSPVPAASAAPVPEAVGSVAAAAVQPAGTAVEVTGVLTNAGANYFDRRTRRLVVEDLDGRRIDVQLPPNLPLEIPPSGTSTGTPARTALPSVLDKRVTVRGVVDSSPNGPVIRSQSIQLAPK